MQFAQQIADLQNITQNKEIVKMSTLTIDYQAFGDDADFIESIVTRLRNKGEPDKNIYGALKNMTASFKNIFEKAVKLVSDKPISQTEAFNTFISAQEWQFRFHEAAKAIETANAELDATLSQVQDLKMAWEPIYSRGENPKVVGLAIKLMQADN